MKPRRQKVTGFLREPLDCVVFIVCPNYDDYHGQGKLFLRYIIFGKGVILDEPDFETAQALLESYKGTPVKMVYGPCMHCVRKGIIGPAGWNTPPHFKPDPYEREIWGDLPENDEEDDSA